MSDDTEDAPIDFSQPSSEDSVTTQDNFINYEMMPGHRAGTTLLFSIDEKMFYKKKHVLKEATAYICQNENCRSKLLLKSDSTCVRAPNWIDHDHLNMSDSYKSLVFRNAMKEAIADASVAGIFIFCISSINR